MNKPRASLFPFGVVDFETLCASDLVKADFLQLDDGSVAEIVEDADGSGRLLFALYKNGQFTKVDRILHQGQTVRPISHEKSLIQYVRVPSGVEDYGSLRTLLQSIRSLIHACVDTSLGQEALLTYFVVSTWFIDLLDVAPYLALSGLPQSGKSTAIGLLGLLCRRSLVTGDIPTSTLYRISEELSPTILIDDVDTATNRRELFHLLRLGTTRNITMFRANGGAKIFGAKVLSWASVPEDPALNSRCINITLTETRRVDLKKLSDPEIVSAAATLQRQLLQFRLANHQRLSVVRVPRPASLDCRTADLYEALALPIADHSDFCKGLAGLLEVSRKYNREPLTPTESAVLAALFKFIHKIPIGDAYNVKNVCARVNEDLMSAGDRQRVTPRAVGAALTVLGFDNRRRTAGGWVLYLDKEGQQRIHRLVSSYGMDTSIDIPLDELPEHCEHCLEYGIRLREAYSR